MKIYTKSGDKGETSLFAGGRVRKDHARLHAYGTVDELNSLLGLVLSLRVNSKIGAMLRRVQGELLYLGADLATPLDADAAWIRRIDGSFSARLEAEMDRFEEELPELKHFILPGGSPAA